MSNLAERRKTTTLAFALHLHFVPQTTPNRHVGEGLLPERRGWQVVRISTRQTADTVSLIVEGRLVGPWVDELRRVSGQHHESSPRLIVDLCGLIAMDIRGHALLDELRRNGATLRCCDGMN